ncbi:MAG: CRTAC1 family protein, partial [Candidatus Poribacteria bacterium]
MHTKFSLVMVTLILISLFIVDYTIADINFIDITAKARINNTDKASCAAFVDYNGDGYLDIYVGNKGAFAEPLGKPNLLYHNNGDGTFKEVAASSGVADPNHAQGVAWGDFNNDGKPDLYVVNDFAYNALYINKGNGTFENITQTAGVKGGIDIVGGVEVPNGYGIALADVNNDGHLDIYVVNLGAPNILYINNGDGTFTDITAQAGVGGGFGPQNAGTAAVFSDCNNDGKIDLFAVNGYGMPSFFYINNGKGFDNATNKAGIGEQKDAEGSVFGDYDNDGNMDLFVTNCANSEGAPLQSILYKNDGKGKFVDVTKKAGLSGEDYSLGASFGDFDNDGYLDLYIVNNGGANKLYRNDGDGTFTDISAQAGVDNLALGSTAVLGDINNDGYLDIYVANTGFYNSEEGDPDVLYLNNGGTNHWLQIQLRGTVSNYTGIGTLIKVSVGNLHQIREIDGGKGYSQDTPISNFGLGANSIVEAIEIKWPSGITQTMTNIKADQRLIIEENKAISVES